MEDGGFREDMDVLVVGPGILGSLFAKKWKKEFPQALVSASSRSSNSHARLKALGVQPYSKQNPPPNDQKYSNVLFCAPPPYAPGASSDYVADVAEAVLRWNGKGGLVFTSSTSVYDVDDGRWCDEDAPVVPPGRGSRFDRLLQAEATTLAPGGVVVRLGGLYIGEEVPTDHPNRAFWFWPALRAPTITGNPEYAMSFCHYQDAAELCLLAMTSGKRGVVYVGTDDTPHTWKELVSLVVDSRRKQGAAFEGFLPPPNEDGGGGGGKVGLGKRVKSDRARKELGWELRSKSVNSLFLGSSTLA